VGGKFLAAWAVLGAVLALGGAARAQVQVDAEPVFGEACIPKAGGTEIIVGLSNTSGATFAGGARIEGGGLFGRSAPEVAFTLAQGRTPCSASPRPTRTWGAANSCS